MGPTGWAGGLAHAQLQEAGAAGRMVLRKELRANGKGRKKTEGNTKPDQTQQLESEVSESTRRARFDVPGALRGTREKKTNGGPGDTWSWSRCPAVMCAILPCAVLEDH